MGCRRLLALLPHKESEVCYPAALKNKEHIEQKMYPKFNLIGALVAYSTEVYYGVYL